MTFSETLAWLTNFSVLGFFLEFEVSMGKVQVQPTFPQSMTTIQNKQIITAYEIFNLPCETVTK